MTGLLLVSRLSLSPYGEAETLRQETTSGSFSVSLLRGRLKSIETLESLRHSDKACLVSAASQLRRDALSREPRGPEGRTTRRRI